MDSMLVACADGRLLAVVIPSDLLLSDKDGWAGELELADVHQTHLGPVLHVQALQGEGAAVSIEPSGLILVWSLLSSHCISSLNMFVSAPDAEEAATAMVASGSGRLVAVGSRAGGVAIFDMSTLKNRRCVFWSRLDTSPVVALATHPSLPVFCIAFASKCVVFVSVTATAVSIIGRTIIDVPVHSVHWIDSGSPGHVLLLLRDATFLRLRCPAHSTPHSIHCTANIETFDPRRVRISAIISGFTSEVSVIACRLVHMRYLNGILVILRRCRGAVSEAGAGSTCIALSTSTRDFVVRSPRLSWCTIFHCRQVISMPSSGNFEPQSFHVLASSKFNRRITCLAISHDVQNIAVGCSDGSITVANVRDAVASYKFVTRHEGASLGCSR
jgi:hypothetical protein